MGYSSRQLNLNSDGDPLINHVKHTLESSHLGWRGGSIYTDSHFSLVEGSSGLLTHPQIWVVLPVAEQTSVVCQQRLLTAKK